MIIVTVGRTSLRGSATPSHLIHCLLPCRVSKHATITSCVQLGPDPEEDEEEGGGGGGGGVITPLLTMRVTHISNVFHTEN